jgi:hypothetical protein
MSGNEPAGLSRDVGERPLERPRPLMAHVRDASRQRTILIRQGSGWQSLAFLCLCLLLLGIVMLGHEVLRGIDRQNQEASLNMVRVERRIQQLESGIPFDSRRRRLLLAMRDHILKVNPRVSLTDAFHYADLALGATERYPAVDPLLLLAIGCVESRYDTQAVSARTPAASTRSGPDAGCSCAPWLGLRWRDRLRSGRRTPWPPLCLASSLHLQRQPAAGSRQLNGGPAAAGYPGRGGIAGAETRMRATRVLELCARVGGEPTPGDRVDLAGQTPTAGRDPHGRGAGGRPAISISKATRSFL